MAELSLESRLNTLILVLETKHGLRVPEAASEAAWHDEDALAAAGLPKPEVITITDLVIDPPVFDPDASSGSEKYGPSDWTQALGEGLTYPDEPTESDALTPLPDPSLDADLDIPPPPADVAEPLD